MNPATPALLNRILAAAEKTLDRPSGDERLKARLSAIVTEVEASLQRAPDTTPRLVNRFTLMLAQCLETIEDEGPLGHGETIVRAMTLGSVLLPFVQRDAATALELARPATSDPERAGSRA